MGFLKSLGKGLKSVAKVALPVAGALALPGVGGAIGGALAGKLGGLGALKTVGGALLKNKDLIAGGASMLSGMSANKRANAAAKDAMALQQRQYADMAPLRSMGLQGMLNTQRPDLTSVYRNPQNPFA